MQATRGFAVSFRRRGRLAGCLTVLALLLAVVVPSGASAVQPAVNEQYLALGDSLAFGYSSQLYHEGEAKGFDDPEGFEHGYANDYLKQVKARAVKAGNNVKLVNDGCPGETTESMIGTNATLIGTLNAADKATQEANELPPVTGEAACAYQAGWNAFKTVGIGGPLHHPYSGSQLEDAIKVIDTAQNLEHKPVTTISFNIGANDELHSLGKVEAEAKAFVEAKVKKVGQEAVEAKLAQIGKEAVEAKLAKIGKEAVEAKLAKVAAEAIEAKVNEHVFIECSEKAFAETGGAEPEFEEKRNECLFTEGKERGEKYFAENQAKLEQEGKEAAEKYYGEHSAQLNKEGEEAAGKYFFEHKAQVEKEGKEAAELYFFEHKAQVEKEGEEAALKYFGEHKFELNAEGELFAAEKIGATVPGLFKQIISNVTGILTALRDGGSLGLDGGKAVNYTGRIIVEGGYNPFGKLFEFAFEGVKFVEEHGGLAGPFSSEVGRCITHQLTEAAEIKKIEEGCFASAVHGGFTSLVKTLNGLMYSTAHGGFAACMSFPVAKFNPETNTTEPERLNKWVNMTNFKVDNGKVDGPDIHPTPEGYKQLGNELNRETVGKCHKEGLPGF
jgi:hypothetical protein